MNDADLEILLIKHFQTHSRQTRDRTSAASVLTNLRTLPRQVASFSILDPALLDWKLNFSWPRLSVLAGCTAGGLLLGLLFCPPLNTPAELRGTAIAYVMPGPECPVICERDGVR